MIFYDILEVLAIVGFENPSSPARNLYKGIRLKTIISGLEA